MNDEQIRGNIMNYIEEFLNSNGLYNFEEKSREYLIDFLYNNHDFRKELISVILTKIEETEKESHVTIFDSLGRYHGVFYVSELIVKNAKGLYQKHENNWFDDDSDEFNLIAAVIDYLYSVSKSEGTNVKVFDAAKLIALEMTINPWKDGETRLEPFFEGEDDDNVAEFMPYRMYRSHLRSKNAFTVKNRIFIATSALILLANYYEGFLYACNKERVSNESVNLKLLLEEKYANNYEEAIVIKFKSNPFFANSEYVYELHYKFSEEYLSCKNSKFTKVMSKLSKITGLRKEINASYDCFIKTWQEHFRVERMERAKSELFTKLLNSDDVDSIILRKTRR